MIVCIPCTIPDASEYISAVYIRGNHVTRSELIYMYLPFRSGSRYDSLQVNDAEKRLNRIRVIQSADIVTLKKEDSVEVYVMIEEPAFFWSISDVGGELHWQKYGDTSRTALWFSGVGEIKNTNFRGSMEVLKIRGRIGHWYGIGLSWSKPLLPSPYFITARVNAGRRPSASFPWHTSYTGESFLVGRTIGAASYLYTRVQHAWKGFDVRNRALYDSAYSGETRSMNEITILEGFNTDTRDRRFNTRSGWFQWNKLSYTHRLSHDSLSYMQAIAGISGFFNGFLPAHTAAFRINLRVRNRDPGQFEWLAYGGDYPMRGFGENAIYTFNDGAHINNAAVAVGEYRFRLFSTPSIVVPATFTGSTRSLSVSYCFDGAIFTDFGLFSHDVTRPGVSYGYAASCGVGLRVLLPVMHSGVSIDAAWPVTDTNLQIYHGTRYIPRMHLYVGLPF